MKDGHLEVSLRSSPHIWRGVSVKRVMLDVILALVPVVCFAIYAFGLSALGVILCTTLSAVLTEWGFCKIIKKQNSIGDLSAVITGLLLGLTLPPAFPFWLCCLGGIVSILLGKAIFGGLGYNPFNPALVGRAFLQAAFPVAITTWHTPFSKGRFSHFFNDSLTLPFTNIVPHLTQPAHHGVAGASVMAKSVEVAEEVKIHDAIAGATPLADFKFADKVSDIANLYWGNVAGSLGETATVLIILCGCYLIFRRVVEWRIPVSILISVAGLSFILGFVTTKCPSVPFMLGSGGLMLGAFFMASDMVTSPVTKLGLWLYGILIGALIVVIRVWGGLPEGVMYSILIGNAVTPLLNRLTQPRIYGASKSRNRLLVLLGGRDGK